MNQKIIKIDSEIEKTREKLSDCQIRLKELERQKTELENADIVAMVRRVNIPASEFEAFARAFMEQRKNGPLPDIDTEDTAAEADAGREGADDEE